MYVASLHTEKARAYDAIGRLKKYVVQHVHGNPFAVYNIYGWTNGAEDKKAREATERILKEINLDARRAKNQPRLIVGDLNGMPEDFQELEAVMDKAMSHDVGAMPTKAGQHVHAPTCWAEGSETGSRRHVALASTSALDMLENLEVEEY